jgi:CheY-like chemotaxis protein
MNQFFQIWLVADEVETHLFIQSVFRALTPAIGVRALGDGDELVFRLHETPQLPRLIVVDESHDTFDRLQTLRQVRTNPSWEHLPVCLLTTDPTLLAVDLGSEPTTCYLKPSQLEDFARLLVRLVQLDDLTPSLVRFSKCASSK